MGKVSRRAFLQTSAGVATGAVAAATPIAVTKALSNHDKSAADAPLGPVTEPSGPAPREPVMAYVRNSATGEVTVLSGSHEATYRDPVLAKRLLAAAPGPDQLVPEGGTDVLAP